MHEITLLLNMSAIVIFHISAQIGGELIIILDSNFATICLRRSCIYHYIYHTIISDVLIKLMTVLNMLKTKSLRFKCVSCTFIIICQPIFFLNCVFPIYICLLTKKDMTYLQ